MVDRQAISLGPKFSTELTALTALLTLEMTLRTSLIWLQTKSQQFASSASWELFHNVTRNDLTALEERLQQIVPGLKKFSMKIHGSDLSESFAMQEIEEIRHLLEGIKVRWILLLKSFRFVYI